MSSLTSERFHTFDAKRGGALAASPLSLLPTQSRHGPGIDRPAPLHRKEAPTQARRRGVRQRTLNFVPCGGWRSSPNDSRTTDGTVRRGRLEAIPLGKEEIMDTFKDGVSLAGRVAARGVGEVTRVLKPSKEPRGQTGETGLYLQRHIHPLFGRIVPSIEYMEIQQPRRFFTQMLKNIAVSAAERAFVAGSQALLRGDVREARDRLSDSFTRDAQCADAYFLHGALSLGLDDYEEAVHSFKKVLLCQQKLGQRLRKYIPSLRLTTCLTENSSLVIFPDLLGVTVLLSLAHRGNHENEEACTVLDQLLGVMPDSTMVGFFLALHLIEAARWREVVSLLKDTLPEDNISLANLILLARALVETGEPETSLEIFKKVLTRTDFDPQLMVDVRFNLATAMARTGRQMEAQEEFARITALYPGYMDVFERLGITAESRRKSAIPPPGSRAASAIPVATDTSPAPSASPVPSSGVLTAQATTDDRTPTANASVNEATVAPPFQESPSSQVGAQAVDHLSLVSLDGRLCHRLLSDDVIIGREEGNIVLESDNAASHRHARIHPEATGYWIDDLGSTNGTFVNGHRIGNRVLLNRGDVVTVGKTVFRIE